MRRRRVSWGCVITGSEALPRRAHRAARVGRNAIAVPPFRLDGKRRIALRASALPGYPAAKPHRHLPSARHRPLRVPGRRAPAHRPPPRPRGPTADPAAMEGQFRRRSAALGLAPPRALSPGGARPQPQFQVRQKPQAGLPQRSILPGDCQGWKYAALLPVTKARY
jgi:hypothetical protein